MLQLVKEEVNHYEAFMNEITKMVRKIMGEEYCIRVYKVMKNNSLELDSLVMLKKGGTFAPNIYLLPYYDEYMTGAGVKELAEKLCDIYRNYQMPVMNDNFSYSYEEVKSFITYRLVSYERNRKLLEKVPYMKYLDMAITFHCLIREDNDGIGTIRITNEHMQQWETSLQEIYRLAVSNTCRLFPPSIRSMDEVILGILKEELPGSIENEKSEAMYQDIFNQSNSNNHKMYILTNQKGINGATCLLYDNVLRHFSNLIHSDFFILPSSIHEVILVPYDKLITKDILAEMVKDVNNTQVARDEVLSDRVYFYSGKNNSVTM